MGGAFLLALVVATQAPAQSPATPLTPAPVITPIEAPPAPIPTPHRRHGMFDLALGGLAGSSASDLTFTLYALHRGGGEGNPVLHTLGPHPIGLATAKVGMTVVTMYALIKLHEHHPRIAMLAAVGATGLMASVAARNAGVLRQIRR